MEYPEGWNQSSDKLIGTEEYGKQSNKEQAFAKLFIDINFNEVKVETHDKKYCKVYSYKDQLNK